MNAPTVILMIILVAMIGFGSALHLNILEKGDLYGIQDLADNATVVYENNLISSVFMSGEDGDWGEHDGEDGDSQTVIEHATVGFELDKFVVDPTPETGWTGDEYFDNRITDCKFHSEEDIDEPICIVCKLIDTHLDPGNVISTGLVELPDGYTASTVVPIELLDGGIDVQKPVRVKIDVVQFIAKEEEHENGGHSTIVTNDGDGEDSIGTADSEGDGDSSGGQDSEDSGDASGGQDSEDSGDSSGSQDSEDSGNFCGCVIDEEISEDSESSQDSEDDGDSSGSQDSEGDGDSSGGQDSEGDGDSSGGQDSEGDCDSSGGQDSEGDGDSSGSQDSEGDGDTSGGQDSVDDGDASGSE